MIYTKGQCPLSLLLFILALEILNRDVKQDERIAGVKIKKKVYSLRAFADDLILKSPVKKYRC